VGAAARTAGALVVFLAFAERARAFEVGLLDLSVQVFEDGAVFLVGHALVCEFEHAGFARAIDDADAFELGLEFSEPFCDFVVVVRVIVGFRVGG